MLMTAAIIGPAHGLKGEVVLDVRSDDPAVLAPGASLVLSGSGSGVVVESTRVHKGRVLARLGGVGTREEAEALRGAALLVAPHDEEDAWYPHQLKGLRAQDPQGLGAPRGPRGPPCGP